MDLDTVRALLDHGVDLLDALGPYDEREALASGTRLREEGHEAALVAAVLSQSRLRARAAGKFGDDAARMLFTPDALEQATRREVADHHAGRFAEVGVERVHDLGCGIGADSLAFTRAGLVAEAVDADEATALLADHNLRTLAPGSRARCGRAEDADPRATGGVWFDPARRTPGRTDASGRTRRTFRLEDMTPPWELLLETAERVPATGAKLSPAFPHCALPHGAEAEWVSTDGDLVECAVWWGPLATASGRTATVLTGAGAASAGATGSWATGSWAAPAVVRVTEADAADAPAAGLVAPEPGHVLYEPDLAVLQAGLVGALARAVDGSELSSGVGYVASDHVTEVPYARRHCVTEVLPAQVKAVKAWVRRNGLTGLTIKKRGVRIDPDEFRKRLGLSTKGGDQATLLLTSGPSGPVALVLTRL